MSSHHIVRETQEPALLILSASVFLDQPLLQDLLEWNPTVVVAEDALAPIMGAGINIDVALVSEHKRQHYQEQLAAQAPIRVLTNLGNGIAGQWQTAVHYLQRLGHREVSIVCSTPLLHTKVPNMWELLETMAPHLQPIIYTQDQRLFFVHEGHFGQWVLKGASYTLYSLQPLTYNTKGLCQATQRQEDFLYLSEFYADAEGSISIALDQKKVGFWLSTPLEGA